MSEEPRQNPGRGLVDRKLVEAPSDFIAGRPKAALLFCHFLLVFCVFFCCFFFLFCFWLVLLLLCLLCLFVLYVILALRPPALQCQLPALFLLFVVFLPTLGFSGEPKQNQGRGSVDRKLLQALPPPVILLFFYFGSLVISDMVRRYLSLWLNWWVSFAPDFQCSVLWFVLSYN